MDVIALLKIHEGFRGKPYQDTVGKTTIGYGRNLTDKGVSEREAEGLLINDAAEATAKLTALPYWPDLNEVRQAVLVDMAVNLGSAGVMKFHYMLDALEHQDYPRAAREMLNSKAAHQLPERYEALARMLTSGEWPEGS